MNRAPFPVNCLRSGLSFLPSAVHRMQAAIPFSWEECPGKPKCFRSRVPGAEDDFPGLTRLQELLAQHSVSSRRSRSSSSCDLTPPPCRRYHMSTSSSGSVPSSAAGPRDSQERYGRTTLQELFRAGERTCHLDSTSLGQLMQSEQQHSQVEPPKLGIGTKPSKTTSKSRRGSFLPYKQGLISIFCMSPSQAVFVASSMRQRPKPSHFTRRTS